MTVLASRMLVVISASALLFAVKFEEAYQMSTFRRHSFRVDLLMIKAFSFPLTENVSISYPFPGMIFWV